MMKQKIKSFFKRNVLIIWIVIVCLALIYMAVMSAYIPKQNKAKKVVSVQSETEMRFSSNYLEQEVIYKNVVISDNAPIVVDIRNYGTNNSTKLYPTDISYTLTAELTDSSGNSITDDSLIGDGEVVVKMLITNVVNGVESVTEEELLILDSDLPIDSVSQTLVKRQEEATIQSYNVYFPSASSAVCLKLTAKPDSSYTDLKEIGAVLAVSNKSNVQGDGWTGSFNDPISRSPLDYDAFNYVIAGHGASDNASIKWNSHVISLNKMYIQDNFNVNVSEVPEISGRDGWKEITIMINTQKNNGQYAFQIFKSVGFGTFISEKRSEWSSAMEGKNENDEGYVSETQYLWDELKKCIEFDDGI